MILTYRQKSGILNYGNSKKRLYSIICKGWNEADYVVADNKQKALEKLKHHYQYNDDLSKASITYLNEALI